jgi:hypothetical protein
VAHLRDAAQARSHGHQGHRLKAMPQTPEQRRKNLRLGLTLLTVALVFGLGFLAKAMLFGL